jgi:hypothetical protein
MLHQTLSKGWCRHGSGLLLGFIVRARGRLVETRSHFAAAEARSSCPAQRSGGPHPSHPRPVVAPLPQREGLLALRFFAPAPLLPAPVHPGPVQPQGARPGARVARSAADPRRADRRAFGRLPGLGHHPGAGRGPGGGQRSWSATERRPSPGCWRALRPKSRHTPVDNGSTTPSVDRCATWQACWSSSLPISRLRIPDRGAAHPGTPRTGTAAALDAGAPAVLPRHPRGHHGPGRRPGQS